MSDPSIPMPPVSVVMPAWNAAETIREALDSVRRQRYDAWEVVVVDDGSTDDTASIVEEIAAEEPRIRILRQENAGVSRARNAGVEAARHPWLVFLDADDLLKRRFLDTMVQALLTESGADGAACLCEVVAHGEVVQVMGHDPVVPTFTPHDPPTIHSCIVRRNLVLEVGGFDPALTTHEDQDLWIRISRTGARFVPVDEVLTVYRMRAGSASQNARQMLEDKLRLLDLLHGPDPRVRNPDPRFRDGLPTHGRPAARLAAVLWPAGLLLAEGGDARALLKLVEGDRDPAFPAVGLAYSIYLAILRGAIPSDDLLGPDWPDLSARIDAFLRDFEARSGAPDLALRVWNRLARLLAPMMPDEVRRIGSTSIVRIEVTEPLQGLTAPDSGVDRVVVVVCVEGESVGTVHLPFIDGTVETEVLTDAVARSSAWEILARLLAHSVYPELDWTMEHHVLRVRRGGVEIAAIEDGPRDPRYQDLHAHVGWILLLQEIWGWPDWSGARFYDRKAKAPRGDRSGSVVDGSADVLDGFPELGPDDPRHIRIELAGRTLGVFTPEPPRGHVSAASARTQVLSAAGYEICVAAVIQGVLGRPLDDGRSLRDRLLERRSAGETGKARGRTRIGRPTSDILRGRTADRVALPAACRARVLAEAEAEDAPVELADPNEAAHPLLIDPTRVPTPPMEARGGRRSWLAGLLRRTPGDLEDDGGDRRTMAGSDPWSGTEARTSQLPVLTYHRIADDPTDPWAVPPEIFETQMRWLVEAGFRTTTGLEWAAAMTTRVALAGRRVALTFDDGYADFADVAWPILRDLGLRPTVFVVTDRIGGESSWDAALGRVARLMDWDTLGRLQEEGVRVGSHTASHPHLTSRSHSEVVEELLRSREALRRELGGGVAEIAYPYGSHDDVVHHLAAGCGFRAGYTARGIRADLEGDILGIPRLMVGRDDTLERFLDHLGDLQLPSRDDWSP